MNKKNKSNFISRLKLASCALLVAFPSFIPVFNDLPPLFSFEKAEAALTPTVDNKCYLVPDTTYNRYEYVSSTEVYSLPYSNSIYNSYFNIRFEKTLTEDVVVSYHTENWTAIKNVDYFPCEKGTTITVKKGTNNTKTSIQLKYSTVPYSVNGVSRQFKVVVDSVVSAGAGGDIYPVAKASDGKNININFETSSSGATTSKSLRLSGELTFKFNATSTFKTTTETVDGKTFTKIDDFNNPLISHYPAEYWCSRQQLVRNPEYFHNDPKNWLSRVINTGMGHAYGAYELSHMTDRDRDLYDIRSFGDYYYVSQTNINGKKTGEGTFDTEPAHKGGGGCISPSASTPGFTYSVNCSSEVYSFGDQIGVLKYFRGETSTIIPQQDHPTGPHIFSSDKCHVADGVAEKSQILKTYIPYLKKHDGTDIYGSYIDIPWWRINGSNTKDNFGWGVTEYQQQKGDSSYDTHTLLFAVMDDVTPTLKTKEDNSAAVYLDKSMVSSENKLRLSIRFSEPVQNFKNTSIDASVVNQLDKILYFKPVQSQKEGSDTVVYEADLNTSTLSGINIQKIELSYTNNYTQITDFAQDGNNHLESCKTSGIVFETSIDKRIPNITTASQYQKNMNPSQKVDINFDISNMNSGTFYYQFRKANSDGSAPAGPVSDEDWLINQEGVIYSKQMNVTKPDNSSITARASLPSGPNYNGLYYVYAKAISEFGVTGTIKNTVGSQNVNYYGPYLLDNIAPVVNLECTPESNATERTFQLSIDEKNELESIVMQIKEKNDIVPPSNEGKMDLNFEEKRPLPTSVTIKEQLNRTKIAVNGTLQFSATLSPADAKEGVTWSLENKLQEDYASINPNTGFFTAKKEGTVTVVAKATYGDNVSSKYAVTITAATKSTINDFLSITGSNVKASDDGLEYYMNESAIKTYSASTTLTFENIINRWFLINNTPTITTDMNDFQFKFIVTDKAGNQTQKVFYKNEIGRIIEVDGSSQSGYLTFFFSNKPYFKSEMTTTAPKLIDDGALNLYAINSQFVFTGDSSEADKNMTISINGSDFVGSLNDPENKVTINAETKNKITLTLGKSGYYEIVLHRNGCYSDKYTFYLTDSFKESTQNYIAANSDELLLTNKVYEYDETTLLYYIDSNWNIRKEPYNGTSQAVFSSEMAASNYMKYKEYEDFYLVCLTSEMAAAINNGTSIQYLKASGEESNMAANGQYWIRYKNNTWTKNSESITAWGWYYYAPGNQTITSINVSNLSKNLNDAVDNVVSKLMESGHILYLFDDDHKNPKTGAPSLTQAQIGISRGFTLTESKNGSKITGVGSGAVGADPNLFINSISLPGFTDPLPVATNLELQFDNNNFIFIAPYDSTGEMNYKLITPKDGLLFKTATDFDGSLGHTGVYSVIEVDKNGAKKFEVYSDRDAPKIMLQVNDFDPVIITGEITSNYYGSTIKILEADNSLETDVNAYVAVYKGGKLVAMNYVKSWDSDIVLDTGIYTVLVGDRSGNNYSFKCYVNTGSIEVNARGGVGSRCTISVTNRDIGELVKFEVYRNGELVDNTLTLSKTFTQNGNYTYQIEDVYGNKEHNETPIEFVRDLPQINFAYLDDLGNAYPYTPGTINHMYIEPREDYQYIATSSLIRIQIKEDNVEWRMSNIDENNYKVSPDGKTITLTKLVSFTFEVWFKDVPNDVGRYECSVDNAPPIIKADYYSSSISVNDSDPTNFDFDNNTPNDLSFVINENLDSYNVFNGNSISASYVKVNVTDATKIKNVIVKQNGKIIFEKELPITSTNVPIDFYIDGVIGKYNIIATDVFDISTNLEYEVKGDILATATIDDIPVDSSITNKYYGNSNVDVNILPGNIAYIMYEDGVYKKTFIFDLKDVEINHGLYSWDISQQEGQDPIINITEVYLDKNANTMQIMYGNPNLPTLGNPEYISIIKHEYFENALDEEGKPIGYDYDVLEELRRYTGYIWKMVKFNADSQTSWQNFYYADIEMGPNKIETIKELYYEKLEFPYQPFEDVDLVFKVLPSGELNVHFNEAERLAKLTVRVLCNEQNVNYFDFELSKEPTPIVFTENGNVLENKDGYIYCSKEAKVTNMPEDIVSAFICYNPLAEEFDDKDFVPYDQNYSFKGDGFYKLIATNKYGNETIYTIVASKDLLVTVNERFIGKNEENYHISYSNEYFANSSIQLIGYNMIQMDCPTGGVITTEGEKTYLTFTIPGRYEVTLKDRNLNKKEVVITIGSEAISFKEEWVIGYNEDALKKDQGYTNQTLSINLNETSLISEGINQIFYKVGENTVYLYGYNNQGQFIPYDLESFKDCIGKQGDGIYDIYFSNKYGDVCHKVINYRITPTLNITRITSLSLDPEEIDLSSALINGVYSNSSVSFASTLHNDEYIFKVKSGESGEYIQENISYQFRLTSVTESGYVTYSTTYLDAYGNYYEINIILLRRVLKFDTSYFNLKDIEGQTYIKENFVFTFDPEDVGVMYTLDSSDAKDYASGTEIYKDGEYLFIMYDEAGNTASFRVIKDSITKYHIEIPDLQKSVTKGMVVNSSSVTFKNDDKLDAQIISAKLDGKKINIINNTFTKSGRYEILVEDTLGNLNYFEFILVNHELNKFEYTVPTNYVITAAFYTNLDGVKSTCMEKVENFGTYLNLLEAAEGNYEIQVSNVYNNSSFTFSITIDKTLPAAELVGCKNGETTTREVSLTKLSKNDVISIYKDGELINELEFTGSETVPSITDGGQYTIVVKNQAGQSVEYNFTKISIPNVPSSVLIIIASLVVSGLFFVGLLLRNRSKSDK